MSAASGIYPFNNPQVSAAPLVMKTRRSELRLTRFRTHPKPAGLYVRTRKEDTFYAIFQLRDHPPHQFWNDGRPAQTVHAPRGCLHIADLNARPSAIILQPVDSLNLELPRAAIDDIAEEAGVPRITGLQVPEPWQTPDPQLSLLEPLILSALAEPEASTPLFNGHLLLTTAIHISERYGGLRRRAERIGGLAPWQERRARELIASQLGLDVSLSEIASECGLSMSHFCKAFKVSTGSTPHGWLQQCRLERARNLLRQLELSLAEVALQCGFSAQRHFSRVFHRETGLTPGVWRRQYRS